MKDNRLRFVVFLIGFGEPVFEIGGRLRKDTSIDMNALLARLRECPEVARSHASTAYRIPMFCDANPIPSTVFILGCDKPSNASSCRLKQFAIICCVPAGHFHVTECVSEGEEVTSSVPGHRDARRNGRFEDSLRVIAP